jgi:hypothetical protein
MPEYNNNVGQHFNFDDVFLRDLIVSLMDVLNQRIYWHNHWEDETRKINVPFYYSVTGGDDFLLDSFVDDVPDRRIELNYDQVPRGIVTLNDWKVKSDQLTNPNVRISRYVEDNSILKRIVSKIRSLPLSATFEIKIKVASEIDLFKAVQAFWNFVYQYQYFDFEFGYLRVNGFFKMPDQKSNKVVREITMDSPIYPEQTFSLNVETFFPLFGEIEEIPPIKRTQWKNYIWKLAGSGAEAQTKPENNYPQPDTFDGELPDPKISPSC